MAKHVLLLIDDNALLTGLYQAAFEKAGFSVVFAHDGQSGLELVHEKKPDGIVLDLLMPGIDGLEVLKEIKGDDATKSIKVIVLTSVLKKEDRDRARQLGASDYLVKSEVRLAEIIERVKAHLQEEQ